MAGASTRVRLRQAFEMAELGFRLMRRSLRRRFPDATEAELSEKFAEWIAGRPPMSGTDLKISCRRRPLRRSRRRTTRPARRAS